MEDNAARAARASRFLRNQLRFGSATAMIVVFAFGAFWTRYAQDWGVLPWQDGVPAPSKNKGEFALTSLIDFWNATTILYLVCSVVAFVVLCFVWYERPHFVAYVWIFALWLEEGSAARSRARRRSQRLRVARRTRLRVVGRRSHAGGRGGPQGAALRLDVAHQRIARVRGRGARLRAVHRHAISRPVQRALLHAGDDARAFAAASLPHARVSRAAVLLRTRGATPRGCSSTRSRCRTASRRFW